MDLNKNKIITEKKLENICVSQHESSEALSYLLYKTMSGLQILLDGTRMNSIPSYSTGAHFSL